MGVLSAYGGFCEEALHIFAEVPSSRPRRIFSLFLEPGLSNRTRTLTSFGEDADEENRDAGSDEAADTKAVAEEEPAEPSVVSKTGPPAPADPSSSNYLDTLDACTAQSVSFGADSRYLTRNGDPSQGRMKSTESVLQTSVEGFETEAGTESADAARRTRYEEFMAVNWAGIQKLTKEIQDAMKIFQKQDEIATDAAKKLRGSLEDQRKQIVELAVQATM